MTSNTLSNNESKAAIRQQIYTLENKLWKREFSIEEIGDLLPANVMVQDMSKVSNMYMNKSGCDVLMHDLNELEALGPEYFKNFFPEEEMAVIIPQLIGLLQRQNPSEVFSIFHRARPNVNTPYKWYFFSSKLLRNTSENNPGLIINMAIEVNNIGRIGKKMNRMLEENEFVKKHFNKFSLLTKREKEIIVLLVDGKGTREISDSLFISTHTVESHRKNIYSKLEIKNFAHLVKFALAYDLISY